eukprot:m.21934 g.21934  ORF g.21934 m.21934 type:complete len:150 (-) comp5401_c0_seq1:2112-2561(-)
MDQSDVELVEFVESESGDSEGGDHDIDENSESEEYDTNADTDTDISDHDVGIFVVDEKGEGKYNQNCNEADFNNDVFEESTTDINTQQQTQAVNGPMTPPMHSRPIIISSTPTPSPQTKIVDFSVSSSINPTLTNESTSSPPPPPPSPQ